MEKPDTYALGRVPWQLFGTFTFVRSKLSEGTRRKMWFSWLRAACGMYGVHFHDLVWMLRSELGESTGRFHYHAVVSGLPPRACSERTCLVLMATWEHLKPQVKRPDPAGKLRLLSEVCGMARIRVFNPALDGLDYFAKDGGASGGTMLSGNTYEAGKFGGGCTVEYSESLERVFSALSRNGKRALLLRGNTDSAKASRLGQGGAGTLPARSGSAFISPLTRSTALAITEQTGLDQLQASSSPNRGRKSNWVALGDGRWVPVSG